MNHIKNKRGTQFANAKTAKASGGPAFTNVAQRTVSLALNKDKKMKSHPRASKPYRSKMNTGKRVIYAKRVLKWKAARFNQLVFVDGATLYFPASVKQAHEKHRASVGAKVIRQQHERLEPDCVGSPGYSKAQGHPIKFWGMLYKGKLKIKIHEDNMTSDQYVNLVHKWMPKALRQMGVPSTSKTRCILIQDKERAINTLDVKTAMKKQKIKLELDFPTSSPDLNVYSFIENS